MKASQSDTDWQEEFFPLDLKMILEGLQEGLTFFWRDILVVKLLDFLGEEVLKRIDFHLFSRRAMKWGNNLGH